MSVVAHRKSAPMFTASEWVSVDIEPEDLEAAGWVYVGKGEDVPNDERVMEVVRRWHDETHFDPWAWCGHSLCDELRGRWAPG